MEVLGRIFYWMLVVVVGSFVSSYVFQKLWTWILVPVFNIPTISLGAAYGLLIIVGFLKSKKPDNVETEDFFTETTKTFFWVLFYGLFSLLFGWTASLFI